MKLWKKNGKLESVSILIGCSCGIQKDRWLASPLCMLLSCSLFLYGVELLKKCFAMFNDIVYFAFSKRTHGSLQRISCSMSESMVFLNFLIANQWFAAHHTFKRANGSLQASTFSSGLRKHAACNVLIIDYS